MSLKIQNYIWLKYLLLCDQQSDYEFKQERDRQIALKLDKSVSRVKGKKAIAYQLTKWYQYLLSHLDEFPLFDQSLRSKPFIEKCLGVYDRMKWIMILLGIITGGSLAGTLFYYQGGSPINVINVIFVVVVLQWCFIFFLLLSLLPSSWQQKIPGFRFVNRLFSQVNLGRWAQFLLDFFIKTRMVSPQNSYSTISDIGQWMPDSSVIKWQSAIWSQWFSLFLNVALLIVAFYLVTFSDLAFGWSSTLQINAPTFLSWIDWLALPWSGILPEAVPDIAMIENTRFYRALSGIYHTDIRKNPAQLGQWWPFLMMLIIVYGVIPRLIILLFLHRRYQHVLSTAITNLPGSYNLSERMHSSLIQTQAINEPEKRDDLLDETNHLNTGDHDALHIRLNDAPKGSYHFHWGDKVLNDDVYDHILEKTDSVNRSILVTGLKSWQTDQEAIANIIGHTGSFNAIIWVKSWEPATLEFIHRLESLVTRFDDASFFILTYGIEQNQHKLNLTSALKEDEHIWRKTLEKHNAKVSVI